MSKATLKKRVAALTVILILSVFLSATTALAITKLIKADKGGKVPVSNGVKLIVPPGSLEEDTVISADLYVRRDVICLSFGPSGTTFDPSAVLKISWKVIAKYDLDDYTLYGPNDLSLSPRITKEGLEYEVPHFSLYYYRRR